MFIYLESQERLSAQCKTVFYLRWTGHIIYTEHGSEAHSPLQVYRQSTSVTHSDADSVSDYQRAQRRFPPLFVGGAFQVCAAHLLHCEQIIWIYQQRQSSASETVINEQKCFRYQTIFIYSQQ